MIFPGLPITIELSGTLKLTKAPGVINTLLPMIMFPITIEFAKMQQLFPIFGVPHVPFMNDSPIKNSLSNITIVPNYRIGMNNY